jgi:hypothetical protein
LHTTLTQVNEGNPHMSCETEGPPACLACSRFRSRPSQPAVFPRSNGILPLDQAQGLGAQTPGSAGLQHEEDSRAGHVIPWTACNAAQGLTWQTVLASNRIKKAHCDSIDADF